MTNDEIEAISGTGSCITTSHWTSRQGMFFMTVGSARGTLKTTVQKITISDVRRAAISINEAQRRLYRLVPGRDIPSAWEKQQ
jgi:hypothetical protein